MLAIGYVGLVVTALVGAGVPRLVPSGNTGAPRFVERAVGAAESILTYPTVTLQAPSPRDAGSLELKGPGGPAARAAAGSPRRSVAVGSAGGRTPALARVPAVARPGSSTGAANGRSAANVKSPAKATAPSKAKPPAKGKSPPAKGKSPPAKGKSPPAKGKSPPAKGKSQSQGHGSSRKGVGSGPASAQG